MYCSSFSIQDNLIYDPKYILMPPYVKSAILAEVLKNWSEIKKQIKHSA